MLLSPSSKPALGNVLHPENLQLLPKQGVARLVPTQQNCSAPGKDEVQKLCPYVANVFKVKS